MKDSMLDEEFKRKKTLNEFKCPGKSKQVSVTLPIQQWLNLGVTLNVYLSNLLKRVVVEPLQHLACVCVLKFDTPPQHAYTNTLPQLWTR